MGEKQSRSFQFCFNGFLKVDFQGSRVTSDGGLILVRELDEHLGLNQLIEQHLTDLRRGKNTQLPLADLLRQSVYSRLAGYEDVNDAERLSQDASFWLIGPKKTWDRGAVPRITQKRAQVSRSHLPGRRTALLSWRPVRVPATRCPKTWSESRRLLYTVQNREAKTEIPVPLTTPFRYKSELLREASQ